MFVQPLLNLHGNHTLMRIVTEQRRKAIYRKASELEDFKLYLKIQGQSSKGIDTYSCRL